MLANTRPFLSAIANIVTHTTFVSGDSTQIVEDVMEEKSLVNVKLMSRIVLHFCDSHTLSAQCRSRSINTPLPPLREGGLWKSLIHEGVAA